MTESYPYARIGFIELFWLKDRTFTTQQTRKETSMIDELMRIGDEVAITIPQENREWGYNPCPDGTKASAREPRQRA